MKEGIVLGILAPDWYIGSVKRFIPELAGKWRAMPLPAWREGERRTSTWGGTMIGITKQSKNPDLAWSFVRFAYMDDEALANRYRKTPIIPPIRSAWSNPVFAEADPYLGGQVLGKTLTDLGDDIPGFLPESLLGRRLGPVAANRARSGAGHTNARRGAVEPGGPDSCNDGRSFICQYPAD